MYSMGAKYSFCSPRCRNRHSATRHVIGICLECGGPVLGGNGNKGKGRYCSWDHRRLYTRKRALELSGPFGPGIEEYLKLTNIYGERTLGAVKATLFQFAAFIHSEGIENLEDVAPQVITRFMAHERERGLTRGNYISRVKSYFDWLIVEGRVKMLNPVIARHHYENNPPDQPRPYSNEDLAFIWNIVEKGDNVALQLAFSIGKECGLRIGEVCNIRLSDVHRDTQSIHVRLPTKNMRTRDVRYHGDVAKYLDLWFELRDPLAPHDHLLHGEFLAALNTQTLIAKFKKLLEKHPAPADSFKFHRLRHTWATRLMNNGMELAVLKELGGWVSWNSMQKYIRVLPETVRRQYAESYQKIQEQEQVETDQPISLLDFALMNDEDALSPINTAA
jgi:site-specific recombinase XerD